MFKKILIILIFLAALTGLMIHFTGFNPDCSVLLCIDDKYIMASLKNEQSSELNTFGYDIYKNMIHINNTDDYIFFTDSDNTLQWIHFKNGTVEKYEVSNYPEHFFADVNIVIYSSKDTDSYCINYIRFADYGICALNEKFSSGDFMSNGNSIIIPDENKVILLSVSNSENRTIDIDYTRIVYFSDDKIYYSAPKYIGTLFVAEFINSLNLKSGAKHPVAYNPIGNVEHFWISKDEDIILVDGITATSMINTDTYILEHHGLFRKKTKISGEQVVQYFSNN